MPLIQGMPSAKSCVSFDQSSLAGCATGGLAGGGSSRPSYGMAEVLAGFIQDFDERVGHALILPEQAVIQADQLPKCLALGLGMAEPLCPQCRPGWLTLIVPTTPCPAEGPAGERKL